MDAQYFQALHKEQLEHFKAQNSEIDEFDVVFDIGEKKLYANKYKLCSISTTFKSMLSERWTKPNEPIEIQDYTFDDFKEFITFIYSGGCELTDKNIFAMTDMAEFYNVEIFKKKCGDFLIKTCSNFKNIYTTLEFAYKYFMEDLKKSLFRFALTNFLEFIFNAQFRELQKSVVYDFVKLNEKTLRQEELFEMVYIWAENQASKVKQHNSNLCSTEIIKDQLSSLLPLFKFHLMKNRFLLKFLVGDEKGKMMKGVLKCFSKDEIADFVQSQKHIPLCSRPYYIRGEYSEFYYWKIYQSNLPSFSSTLIKNNDIDWYLVCYRQDVIPLSINLFVNMTVGISAINQMKEQYKTTDYYLAIKHRNQLQDGDCLLAEMFAENGFQLKNAKVI